jgi:flagellar biosynthesis protein FlhG
MTGDIVRPQFRRPLGRILAVASGKGGVGKTVLSVGLAQAFARAGERVLLFDGDLGMANVDVQLGLRPKTDIGSVIAGRAALAEAIIPVRLKAAETGFDVIAGRSGSGALAGLSADRAAELAAGLIAIALSYDRVLLDLAAGAEPALLRLASAADDTLVVLADEPTSLTDAYAFVKMLRLRNESAVPLVAVNLAADREHGRRTFEGFARTCRNFLGLEPVYAGAIRRDEAVAGAVRRQQGVVDFAPRSHAAVDLETMARLLAQGAAAKAA